MGVTRQTAHQAVHALIGMGCWSRRPTPPRRRCRRRPA
ncbi:hypothetical protein AB0D54_25715 [Streptomyces xanthophaeus]